MKDTSFKYRALTIAIFMLIWCTGCEFFGGLRKTALIKHPDAPMLIKELDGDRALIHVYDKQSKSLIEYGWIDMKTTYGWTIVKYDWAKFIDKKRRQSNAP